MTNRVKAADVARLAGVSRTAVSFVLSGRAEGNIAPATAERVRAAAAELGYTPDRVAQSLRLQRTHVVGLVTDAIASSPFAGRILSGAVERAADSGYVLVLFDSQGRAEREQDAVEELSRRRVDGLVYASMQQREARLPDTALPMVLANCLDPAGALTRHTAVLPDNHTAGADAARHLLGLGHRRLVMLGGPGDPAGDERSAGYREATAAAGLAPAQARIVGIGRMWSIDHGYEATMATFTDSRGLLARDRRPTAVFAVNDRVATGALLALTRLGLDVPAEVSIVGFDDQEQLAAHVVPALTTYALPHRRMGEVAVDRLLAHLSRGRDDPAETLTLSCAFIERDSTAPPPS